MLSLHCEQRTDIIRLLRNGVQVFLLLGDRGIGKRTLIRTLAADLKAKLVEYEKLHVAEARDLKDSCYRILHQSHVFLVNGDNTTLPSWNTLLKLLEAPPSRCAFFLSCSVAPVNTVTSRSNVVLFPRLDDQNLLEVLKFKGMTPSVAVSLIPLAAGSVDGAYAAYRNQEQHKNYAKYFQALKDRDERFVFDQVRKINKDDIRNLLDLADQLLMSRYGMTYNDTTFVGSPVFIETVKKALLVGSIPAVGWMRAWTKTTL